MSYTKGIHKYVEEVKEWLSKRNSFTTKEFKEHFGYVPGNFFDRMKKCKTGQELAHQWKLEKINGLKHWTSNKNKRVNYRDKKMENTIIRKQVEVLLCPHCNEELKLEQEKENIPTVSLTKKKVKKTESSFIKWTEDEDRVVFTMEPTDENITKVAETFKRSENAVRQRI